MESFSAFVRRVKALAERSYNISIKKIMKLFVCLKLFVF